MKRLDRNNDKANASVEVRHLWMPPAEYAGVQCSDMSAPLTDLYPKGLLTRMVGETVLEIKNLTREEAEQDIREFEEATR